MIPSDHKRDDSVSEDREEIMIGSGASDDKNDDNDE